MRWANISDISRLEVFMSAKEQNIAGNPSSPVLSCLRLSRSLPGSSKSDFYFQRSVQTGTTPQVLQPHAVSSGPRFKHFNWDLNMWFQLHEANTKTQWDCIISPVNQPSGHKSKAREESAPQTLFWVNSGTFCPRLKRTNTHTCTRLVLCAPPP